jgi:hypothetical protein
MARSEIRRVFHDYGTYTLDFPQTVNRDLKQCAVVLCGAFGVENKQALDI